MGAGPCSQLLRERGWALAVAGAQAASAGVGTSRWPLVALERSQGGEPAMPKPVHHAAIDELPMRAPANPPCADRTFGGRRPSVDDWLAALPGLKRVGREHVGPCPLCGGDDRFRVGERGAFCRRCCPRGGPAYGKLLRAVFRGGFRAGAGAVGPRRKPKPPSSAYALRILGRSGPVPGTLAERYLRRRGLGEAAFGAIGFNPRVHTSDGTHPALVVAVAPDFGAPPVACHCVLLGADGRKADMPRPRRSFGPVGAGAAYLGDRRCKTVALAEGVENALSAALISRGGHPVATLGAGALAQWRPPGWCERAVVFADGDAAGHGAAGELKRRMGAAGFLLEVRWLLRGDANDLFREKGHWRA